jgi:cellulose biosynthesis protein BcsQ
MKILFLDNTSEGQALLAKRLESFSQSDMEMLDLKVRLVGEKDFSARVVEADVLILGSGVQERAVQLARQAISLVPWLHIIMFVTDEAYGGGAFRIAHSAGVRKVFPESAGPLDLLQELVGIHAEFRKEGRTREGRVVVVAHAKGSVGATSITAALAEVCSVYGRRTMLWDLDVETSDLSRSLTVNGIEARVVSGWVNGSRDISRETLKDALVPISSEVSVLMPPDTMAEAMDLVCHTDGIEIAQRIIELSRVLFDVALVDTAGRIGPATGALLRVADVVVIVVDDSILGLTALDLYLHLIKTLVSSMERVVFVVNPYSGTSVTVNEIAALLEPVHELGEALWRLPVIPNDPKAELWPGTGRTLYSLGSRTTRSVLEKIANELGLLGSNSSTDLQTASFEDTEPTRESWLSRLLGKKNN